jgi:hypothetical protein
MDSVAGKIARKTIVFKDTYRVNRNVLGIPTFVLNPKAATKLDLLEYSWVTKKEGEVYFSFRRIDPDIPFPLPIHALYFDILVGLFEKQWNRDGELYFTIANVLKSAGKAPDGRARDAVIEMIKRYMFSNASWKNSWNGRDRTWSNPLINACDIWDGKGNMTTGKLGKNPRNKKNFTEWHSVTFCKQIVESVKDGHNRIFYAQTLKGGLKADSYAVYRYFYGFSDLTAVRRPMDTLLQVFPWTGRESRFQPWLEARLNDCKTEGLITSFSIKNDWVVVKCKNLKQLKDTVITVDVKAESSHRLIVNEEDGSLSERKIRRKKKDSSQRIALKKLTHAAVIEEYDKRRGEQSLNQNRVEMIEEMRESERKKKMALSPSIIEAMRNTLTIPGKESL